MKIKDHTFLTEDEEYMVEERTARKVEHLLKGLHLDTYNHRYTIQVTVLQIDADPVVEPDDKETL